MPLPHIRARLFGAVDLRIDGEPIEWKRRDARALFILLLATSGHRLRRDAAIEALWPEASPNSARNSLYKSLHAMRRALEPYLENGRESAFVVLEHDSIGLREGSQLWIDVDQFEELLRMAAASPGEIRPLLGAVELYRGLLLRDEAGCDWAIPHRERLRFLHRQATLELAELEMHSGSAAAALGRLQRGVEDDPFDEDLHRALIEALVANGQAMAAREHLTWAREVFEQELGLPLAIDAEIIPSHPTHRLDSMLRSPVRGLPGIPTPTLGRDREITSVLERLFAPGTRLVTIVGPGGVGKTRVAIEAATRAIERSPDGIVFVDFSRIDDDTFLIGTIGQALEIGGHMGGSERSAVFAALRHREMLLVLDNLEHLPAAAREVAALLAEAPRLRVLATSRVPLRIRAETQVRLDPLPLPPDQSGIDELLRSPVVQLYLRFAEGWRPGSADTGLESLTKVARLCRYLDGIPLAIELAAARPEHIGIEQVIEHVSNRFHHLRDGPVDLPARHQTLEATLSWSIQLLSSTEAELFARLGLFLGGAEKEDLEAVVGKTLAAVADDLVDQHLASWHVANGHRRLIQLDTMRAYALQLMARRADEDQLRRAHAEHFAGLVSKARASRPSGLRQIALASRLEREQGNLQRAIASALRLRDGALAARICGGAGIHWFTHGPGDAALRWIDQTLELASSEVSDDLAWTALWGAAISWQRGDVDRVEYFEAEARRNWEQLGSNAGLARLDHVVAQRMSLAGRHEDALMRHRANLRVFEETNEIEGVVFSRAAAADELVLLGRYDETLNDLETALSVAQEAQDYYLQSHVLTRLPGVLLDLGDLDRSEQLSLEAERVALLVHDRLALPWAAVTRAWIAWEREDDRAAIEFGQLAIDRFRDAGNSQNELHGLVPMVAGMSRSNDPSALSAIRAVLRNLIDQPTERMLGLGLPAIAECVWRFGATTEAWLIFDGSEPAATQASLPRHGISARYQEFVRRNIESSGRGPEGGQRIDMDAALELASLTLSRFD